MTPLDLLHEALLKCRRRHWQAALVDVAAYRKDGRGCEHLDDAATLIAVACDLALQGETADLVKGPLNGARHIVHRHLVARNEDFAQTVLRPLVGPDVGPSGAA
jgi:hypothetical protein